MPYSTERLVSIAITVLLVMASAIVHEVAHGSLRLSLSEYNTEEEIDYIIAEVPKVVEYLRSISPVWEELETGKRRHLI